MTKGGQVGNRNSAKGRQWYDALRKECVQRNALELMATKVVDAALDGERWAIEEIGNRMDGKPAQALELSGPGGDPIETVTKIELVDGNRAD